MKRVLVCEDEDSIREFVVINLVRSGYEVVDVNCGEDALKAYDEKDGGFDVALLDIMMLSAKSQEIDKISCLMSGADDYITKPFSISELIARVDAVCRRVNRSGSKPEEASQIVSGPFTLNLKSRTVFKNGEQIDLTQVEYQIMEYFFKNQNTALDRSSILNHIWGESYYGDDKIVDVNIRRIRMKIEDEPSNPKYILTIWGFGYKWAGGSN